MSNFQGVGDLRKHVLEVGMVAFTSSPRGGLVYWELGRVRAGRALYRGFISEVRKLRLQPARGHTGSWGWSENKDPGLPPAAHTRC